MNDLWQYEKEALAAGHTNSCGCDEAGAGPLAGPVYAAAVILPLGLDIDGLDELSVLHVPSPLLGSQSTTSLPVTCCVVMSPSSSVRVRVALA